MRHLYVRHVLAWAVVGLTTAPTPAGEKAQSGAGSSAPAAQAKLDDTDATLRLRFEVLELALSPEEVERINKSGEPFDVATLATGIAERGDSRVKYSFGGRAALNEVFAMTIGHRLPFVSSSAVSQKGQRTSTVQYEHVGCILELTPVLGSGANKANLKVAFRVEVSDFGPQSTTEISEGLYAPTFSEMKHEFTAHVPLGRDAYFWSLAGLEHVQESTGGLAVYVYRVRFDPIADK